MEFPQQIEETLLERSPASSYDVIMESPLYAAMERKIPTNKSTAKHEAVVVAASLPSADKMISSINSTLEDTTPSDSGVQMLDSESSMMESITSQIGFDFEELRPAVQDKDIEVAQPQEVRAVAVEEIAIVDTNSNVTATTTAANTANTAIEDAMTTSACSTFDTTENIVYRRKVRKANAAPKAPKKRVSFHEDILKNTRTDNIHIEHGFITYKNGRKMAPHVAAAMAGRYSWCSESDGAAGNARKAAATEICAHAHDDNNGGENGQDGNGQRRRCIVYRNACSDVLDYGNSDVYDTNESKCLQYDNSGVFEYAPQTQQQSQQLEGELYRCSCSSSNSSLDSDENDKNSNRQQYGQAKSSSCDCIGMSNANNNLIGENCYFSEPNIDNLKENKKSVWNKEKMPKSSCLKKTKRHTNIIHEQDLSTKVKKFNVHDMNQLFGSLKSIFTMPLPERGVPEGSEDLQSVIECVPELEQTPEHKPTKQEARTLVAPESPPLKSKPFLSKSLDGSKQAAGVKKFVHNVDEQLRRKNDEELYAPTRQSSAENGATGSNSEKQQLQSQPAQQKVLKRQEEIELEAKAAVLAQTELDAKQFRNKFIINCESTVFEHTGVSYCYDAHSFDELRHDEDVHGNVANLIEQNTPIAQSQRDQLRSAFSATPLTKTFTNFFRSFKETTPVEVRKPSLTSAQAAESQHQAADSYFALKMPKKSETPSSDFASKSFSAKSCLPTATSSSTISDLTTSTGSLPQQHKSNASSTNSNSLVIGQELRNTLAQQSRHLPSPLKKRASGNNLMSATQPARYGVGSVPADPSLLSPDLYNSSSSSGYVGVAAGVGYSTARGGSGRDSKSTILSEEFDDILTITTDTDKNESDIVILDYPTELNERGQAFYDYANLLKPPQPPAAKTSLINRFLRNVTQKKILESSIRKNDFFADKLKNEQKLFAGNLYVRGARPKNYELIDDLNAEIAMEIEMSGANSPRRELTSIDAEMPGDISRFELGIGEISIDIFNGNYLHILNDASEQLMKVFKLYTGYSREGFMTPVLVFLTDKTLYVTDLVRNRLCSKFVLAYSDLDVILMGPYGNTVLLSNSARDMQQVLLAGGPYPADGLVANLELCARRSGSTLPAVGQLTLEHLIPLQAFVRENSCVAKEDTWMYYAVVNVPAGTLGSEQEPLGPHIKGFLMHRRIKDGSGAGAAKHGWHPGYFLLKAGVLYMFNDSTQKLPSWAMALAECQGARRALKAGRPHCFEIMLKGQLLQLAAPDEYVASEWLQALLQTASGLFEMQEKHKTLGCTLVVTQNHLITLREDFNMPLRQINKMASGEVELNGSAAITAAAAPKDSDDCNATTLESSSVLSSTMSTPTRLGGTQRSVSSLNSTPTKLSQLSRSTTTCNTASISTTTTTNYSKQALAEQKITPESYSNMSSVYGKNAGLEILTCADIKEMTGIKIPSHNDTWWCVLEFSCQEVRESSDDLVIFFASSSEMQRFLRLLEQLWQAKNNDLFPITVLDEDDIIAEQCTMLYMDINRSWEPLLSAALGYPL